MQILPPGKDDDESQPGFDVATLDKWKSGTTAAAAGGGDLA